MPCKGKRFLKISWEAASVNGRSRMNLAALVQSQTLATLLAALAPGAGLEPGKTVEARLLSLGKDGTVTALVDGVKIDLVLAGPEVRQAALQPGTTLTL